MFRGTIPGFADDHNDVEQRLISKNDWYVYNFHSHFIFGCYSGEKRLVSTLRLVHHSHHELAVSHSRRAGPSQPGPARPCQGLKVDMRIALRRRGGPSVLASSINIVHALVRVFSVDCSNNMYDLSINKLYILLGNLYICPHNRKVFVRMVILFYPATSARVHFTKCDHCATAASFRRWLAPVVGAFLTVAYRWSIAGTGSVDPRNLHF